MPRRYRPARLRTCGQRGTAARFLMDRFATATGKQDMPERPSISKRGQVPPFFVMEVMRAAFERERAGERVLHLEVGQPSTGAPAGVVEAARGLLGADKLGYTDALGIPP